MQTETTTVITGSTIADTEIDVSVRHEPTLEYGYVVRFGGSEMFFTSEDLNKIVALAKKALAIRKAAAK